MSKITLDDIASGYNLSKVNANFQRIEDALNNEVLFRDVAVGEPNQLEVDVDMNSNRLLNVPDPVLPQEPVTLNYLNANFEGGVAGAAAAAQAAADAAIAAAASISATQLTPERFSGDGIETSFTVVTSITAASSILTFVSGVYQTPPDDFTVTGQTITFAVPPPIGVDNITFLIADSIAITAIVDNGVSTAKIQDLAITTPKINTSAVTTAKIANDAITTAKILDGEVTLAKLAAAVTALINKDTTPIGTIAARLDNQVPTDWLVMNNQELEIATYSVLHGYLDAAVTLALTDGAGGAGSSHFRLPDLKGYFLRGAGSNADTLATGAVLGTYVQDTFKAHTHTFTHENTSAFTGSGIAGGQNVAAHTTTTSSTGGAETAPKHITVNYLIKAL